MRRRRSEAAKRLWPNAPTGRTVADAPSSSEPLIFPAINTCPGHPMCINRGEHVGYHVFQGKVLTHTCSKNIVCDLFNKHPGRCAHDGWIISKNGEIR